MVVPSSPDQPHVNSRRTGDSLHSKRFRGVGEQRKTKEQNRSVFCTRNWGESQNKKEGVGEGKEGNACRQTHGF